MLIIVGTDLVGKTLLAKQLVKRLNDAGWPHTYEHTSVLPDSWEFFWSFAHRVNPFVVMDRFHFGELAYGPATNNKIRHTPESFRALEALIALNAGFTVMITAESKVLEYQYDKNPHLGEHFDLSTVIGANQNYIRLFDGTYPGFKASIDASFCIPWTPHQPPGKFPGQSASFVDGILIKYCKRLKNWCGLMNERRSRTWPAPIRI